MNYQKIYQDFIASRREREATIVGYSEKHHIVPKALGGGNEKENLIRLTPEDHFFVHLLLAKIYGGAMCAAIAAMCNLANASTLRDKKQLRKRVNFAHVRAMLAKHYRLMFEGPSGPQADKTEHELRHPDKGSAVGNRFELSKQTGLTRQRISAVLLGAKITANGWYSPVHNPAGKTRSQLISEGVRSNEIHILHHRDGRKWGGTKLDFEREFGQKLWFQPNSLHVGGWYKTESEAKNHSARRRAIRVANSKLRGNIAGHNNPNADKSEYRVKSLATGEIKTGTRLDIAEFFGVTRHDIGAITTGAQKTAKGLQLC